VKLYLDEDLSPTIAAILRQKRIDTITTYEAGNIQLDDRSQLDYATREGRAIVTANVVDFIELAHDAVARNTEHAGIVLIPSSFHGDEFQVIADAIFEALKPYRAGLRGLVLYVTRV
jgi:hypothetical protein